MHAPASREWLHRPRRAGAR